MDIYGTTRAVITDIYKITTFIRGVVAEAKALESDRQDIKDKLDHEIFFLDSFKQLFFDDQGAFIHNDRLPPYLQQDCNNILSALRKTLAEYGMLAAKYGLLDTEENNAVVEESKGEEDFLPSLYKRVQSKVKGIKKRVIDWALFDKEKLVKMLAKYSEWTERLRQTMSLMLLTSTAYDDHALERFAGSKQARDVGLLKVAQRQLLIRKKPPEGFTTLQGCIVKDSEVGTSSNIKLAIYEDGWGRVEVVVEYRKYNSGLIQATEIESPMLDTFKAPIRDLAWLLHTSFSPDEQGDGLDTPDQSNLSTLRYLGYLDQPEQYQVLFLYKLPRSLNLLSSPKIVTLHDVINAAETQGKRHSSKPSLGNRFFLAHSLASTVFNVHISGWVHKNIWSRGVIIFPSTDHSTSSEGQFLVPYLTGWGIARPVSAATELAADTEIEPNFYRHPLRQGQPSESFDVEHDIYSLGVVLLEIGLWATVSAMFKKQVDQATIDKQLPLPETIKNALVEKARAELEREMGFSYMKAVEKCLKGDFGVTAKDEQRSELSVAFREMVVEVSAKGLNL